jgi:hypothetical protein
MLIRRRLLLLVVGVVAALGVAWLWSSKMKEKRYFIPRDRIRKIASGRGSCLASDRIMVDGRPVGFFYREAPDGAADSGWKFQAGDESAEYCNDPENWGVYDLNTVVNYDAEILPFLDHPTGVEYDRDESGKIRVLHEPQHDEPFPLALPDAEGSMPLGEGFVLELPGNFGRRFEGDTLRLIRPGLILDISAFDKAAQSRSSPADWIRRISPSAFDRLDENDGSLRRVAYRMDEHRKDERPTFTGLVFSEARFVLLTAYFESESEVEAARAVWRSIRVAPR